MKFFEKPKLVTAVVFFAETILCLMKVEYFLYLDFYSLVLSLLLLSALPLGFHAVYSYILNDMVDGVKTKPSYSRGSTYQSNENRDTEQDSVKHSDKVEAYAPQSEVVAQPEDVVKPEPVVEEVKEDTTTEPVKEVEVEVEAETNQKKIQIVDTDEVYLEKDESLPRTRAGRKKQK